jgi:hypothetical protein
MKNIRGNTKEEFASINQVAVAKPKAKLVRGMDYNEIFIVYRYFNKFKAGVYNDIGKKLISHDEFDKIDVDAVKKEFNAFAVVKNGPRFWVMDEITGYCNGQERTIGGFEMNQPGVLNLSLNTLKNRKPYVVNTVNRKTRYTFKKGEKLYELINDKNEVFTMQSGSKEVDKNLTIESLYDLGSRLNLPSGWRYQVRILDEDITFFVDGTAYVVQDEFRNSYQKNPH